MFNPLGLQYHFFILFRFSIYDQAHLSSNIKSDLFDCYLFHTLQYMHVTDMQVFYKKLCVDVCNFDMAAPV